MTEEIPTLPELIKTILDRLDKLDKLERRLHDLEMILKPPMYHVDDNGIISTVPEPSYQPTIGVGVEPRAQGCRCGAGRDETP